MPVKEAPPVEETEAERQVREEQEAHDAELEAEQAADAKAHEEQALFDKARYDDPELALPKVDGEGVDKIAIGFSGRPILDRTNPADVELIRRMHLGHDITLMVECKVSGIKHGYTTNRDGDLDAVLYEVQAKVEKVYRATVPEA